MTPEGQDMTIVDHVSQQAMPPHGPEGEHTWVARLNDEGDLYEVCLECGKQSHWEPLPNPLGTDEAVQP
jgi:hypothetical protein